MDINSKIREYLIENNISQIDLALKLGISNTSLNRSLKSEDLKISLFLKICQALKVTASKFFDGTEIYSDNEIEALKIENTALKKQVSYFTDQYENEKHGMINLFKIIESTFSEDKEIAEDSKNILRVLVKYRNGEIPESPSGTKMF